MPAPAKKSRFKKAQQPIESPHAPGPWATMPNGERDYEIWTTLPSGDLRRLALVPHTKTAAVDASLMAMAPQLAHEIRALTALLEKIVASPGVLDSLVEVTKNTELEANLLQRLGSLRRLARLAGPALTPGTYEPSPAEARWQVPEHAYRAKEDARIED